MVRVGGLSGRSWMWKAGTGVSQHLESTVTHANTFTHYAQTRHQETRKKQKTGSEDWEQVDKSQDQLSQTRIYMG